MPKAAKRSGLTQALGALPVMSKFQKTANTIFFCCAALFTTIFLLAAGESPFLIFMLAIGVTVFYFTVDRAITQARNRQGKDHGMFVTTADFSHLDRKGWLSIVLAMFGSIVIMAIGVNLFGRGA